MLRLGGMPFVDVQLIVSIIAIAFYSYILYVMWTSKSKSMKSAFFRIYIVTGICDILGIIALEWSRAELKTSFGPAFEPLTRLLMTMTGINFFTHILGCFLMTLNRFTAVRFPCQHEEIWCPQNVYALIVFEIFFSIIIHIEALLINFVYKPTGDGGWVLAGRNGSINRVRVIASCLTILYEAISIVLISYTIYKIHKQLRNGNHRLAQDVSLIFVTAVNCFMSIFECIYDISFLLHYESPLMLWIQDQYEINTLLVMTTNAFSIFVVSHALRQEFRQRWCKSTTEVQSLQTTVRTRDITAFGLN